MRLQKTWGKKSAQFTVPVLRHPHSKEVLPDVELEPRVPDFALKQTIHYLKLQTPCIFTY